MFVVCKETELFIRKLMFVSDNNLPSKTLLNDIVCNVCRKLCFKMNELFPDHEHQYELLKAIAECYCKIRLHNLAKRHTEKLQGDLIRKKFSKLILFSHQ